MEVFPPSLKIKNIKNKMKTTERKALLTGHIGKTIEEITEFFLTEEPTQELCEYSVICKKDCAVNNDCRIKVFYQKYPNYQNLNVGSRI